MQKYDFSKIKVLIVGDVMLDQYLWGNVGRISPEAPVPVVNITETRMVPGGAANVANNVASLEGEVMLLGLIGADINGQQLKSLLTERSIKHDLITSGKPTISKIRIIGNKQQMIRLDYEETTPPDADLTDALINKINTHINNYDIVVLSDYNKGTCTPEICRHLITSAKSNNIPVIIDPKGKNWDKYRGATLVTPNMKELNDLTEMEIMNDDTSLEKHLPDLFIKLGFENLLITRSEKGMSLFDGQALEHFPTMAREVYDVSGAGDTVIAALTLGIASGYSLRDAVEFANIAAGIVVGKIGTVPIQKSDLYRDLHLSYNKIISPDDIKTVNESLKKENKKIVFTNGCFDILHIGHVKYLEKAKELGDILILGLNTDNSVRRLKGEDRPVNKEDDRAAVLAGLSSVDYIVKFDDDTPLNLIKSIKPDFLVKGGDYTIENVIGGEFAGQVVLIDFVEGYSTSRIIKKLRNSND